MQLAGVRRFSIVTSGKGLGPEDLDRVASMVRAIRDMGLADMRAQHDTAPGWAFHDKNGLAPFSKGTIRMDQADIGRAMDLFYEVMGWDRATGAPTQEAYARLGLADVGQALAAKKLVPSSEGGKP